MTGLLMFAFAAGWGVCAMTQGRWLRAWRRVMGLRGHRGEQRPEMRGPVYVFGVFPEPDLTLHVNGEDIHITPFDPLAQWRELQSERERLMGRGFPWSV